MATPHGLVSCELQAATILSILVDKPSSATWRHRRGGGAHNSRRNDRRARSATLMLLAFVVPVVRMVAAASTTALMTPWRYPQPGVSGQYLTGNTFPDYCPVITGYSNGDCQDTTLTPSGTNYYGFVYSVCSPFCAGWVGQRHAILHGAFDSLPCEKGAPEV